MITLPKSVVLEMVLAAYANEPCRICGDNITLEQIKSNVVVFAGYSADSAARSAHKNCWDTNKDQSTWKHQ